MAGFVGAAEVLGEAVLGGHEILDAGANGGGPKDGPPPVCFVHKASTQTGA